MMKKQITTLLLVCFVLLAFSQEEEQSYILKSNSTWSKEIIKFPLGFARTIKFEGFEELRFPANWSKQETDEFWSYVWVWNITNKENLTTYEIAENIESYFDGLMDLGPESSNKTEPKTTAVFIEKETINNTTKFVGKVKTFDSRFTKKPITFKVTVSQFYCKSENKLVSLFRLSPKDFENTVWSKLNSVSLIDDVCKD